MTSLKTAGAAGPRPARSPAVMTRLPGAGVYVAGDVGRPVVIAGTGLKAAALEDGCLDLLSTVKDMNAAESFRLQSSHRAAYAQIMATRPQTLYRLADSPADLAAFMLDHGDGTGQPGLVEQVLQGHLDSDLTRDDLLDNITLYWLTNTGVSSARLYWENKADFFDAKPITVPFAISVFPDELYQAPRSWAERAYPHNLIHYNRLDRGGHFAAWEQPGLFSAEMRASFKTLR
jgi:pimeloyl-ACP methyl ester carboxylesterase